MQVYDSSESATIRLSFTATTSATKGEMNLIPWLIKELVTRLVHVLKMPAKSLTLLSWEKDASVFTAMTLVAWGRHFEHLLGLGSEGVLGTGVARSEVFEKLQSQIYHRIRITLAVGVHRVVR